MACTFSDGSLVAPRPRPEPTEDVGLGMCQNECGRGAVAVYHPPPDPFSFAERLCRRCYRRAEEASG